MELAQINASHVESDSLLPKTYRYCQHIPFGSPFPHYQPNKMTPCAITPDASMLPIHMLKCGHIVAIDNLNGPTDNRCALNCLHVAEWVKNETVNAPEEAIDLRPGNTLAQALTSSVPVQMTKNPIMPEETKFQAHYYMYCETCYGIPASSYFVMHPESTLKHSLALTRAVIEHFTGDRQNEITGRLCLPHNNPSSIPYDLKLAHKLHCGHEVMSHPPRPCASNCSDNPECKGRRLLENNKQGDIIFCYECTYRAEKLYERFASVGKGVTVSGPKAGLFDVLHLPQWKLLHSQAGPSHDDASHGDDDHHARVVGNELPAEPKLEPNNSSTGLDTEA